MNPDSPTFRIRNPFSPPISTPMSRHNGSAIHADRPTSSPPEDAGMINATASAGARPTVDSSDRSILPTIRIIACPSTSNDSSLCWVSTAIRLPGVRKIGDSTAPMISRMMITGTSARSW